jgi:hypothetical protein
MLLSGKYEELRTALAPDARQRLTLEFLRERAGGQIRASGQLGAVGEPVVARDGAATLVSFPVRFAATSADIQFAVNGSGEIAAFMSGPLARNYRQSGSVLRTATRMHSAKANSLWAPMNGSWEPHSQYLKEKDIPRPGSGPRTGTRRSRRNHLRQPYLPLDQETVEDPVRAVALMPLQPEIATGSLYLPGHSPGGYAAPRIAAEDDKLSGLIFLAANVTAKDFAVWKSALGGRGNVSFREYAPLNHLFIAAEGKPSPADYRKPGNAEPRVIADIANWISIGGSR